MNRFVCGSLKGLYRAFIFRDDTKFSLFQDAPKSGSEGQVPMCTFGCIFLCTVRSDGCQ